MNIQYISDLHLEFLQINDVNKIIKRIIATAPILVLAGDIGNPYKHHYKYFIEKMSIKFEMIFIIAGNHEYYHNYIVDTQNECVKICEEFNNVIFLDNSTYEYNGYLFLGTTLWSRIDDYTNEINDTLCINDITINRYNHLFTKSKEFIIRTLDSTDMKVVVITHHLPSCDLIDAKYKTKEFLPINQWFATNLNEYFTTYQHKISAWIYGHTHTANVCEINGVKLYCNPAGYKGENHHTNYNASISL